MEPGVQTCEETLSTGARLVPRHRLAAGADPAPPRPRGALRLRLPDAAHADVKSLDGPSGAEADFTDLHAWAEVYVPGAGWIGLDPTSGLFAGEGHIPLACTPDPSSAAPVTGDTDECEVEFDYANRVSRVREDPRVTKPYTEEQWQRDRRARPPRRRRSAARRRAPDDGRRADLRVDRRHGGRGVEHRRARPDQAPARRRPALPLAANASRRAACCTTVRASGIPGEALPRWALSCFWRDDGSRAVARRRAARRRVAQPRLRPRAGGTVHRAFSLRTSASIRVSSCPGTRTSSTTSGRRARCRSTSTRCSADLDDPGGTLAPRRAAAARSRHGHRLRAAARLASDGGRRRLLAQRPLGVPARAHVPDSGRLADGLPAAARLAAVGPARASASRRSSAASSRRGRRSATARRPLDRTRAREVEQHPRIASLESSTAFDARASPLGGTRPHRALRRAARRQALRLPAAGHRTSSTTSICSPASRRRRPSWRCRCCSKATSRRATRACGASRSRPTPA